MTTTSHDFLREIVSPENAILDIVAVHGLNPINGEFHAEKTWTAENGSLWLRDFLPKSLPAARILLFGYNSNVAIETSIAGVREQAVNLLNRLSSKRRDAPSQRPIIFIAHSLGGIVVKRALVEAKLNDMYRNIREATRGLAFFATPHRGGNYAKLGDIAAKIARTVLKNQPNTFLDSLQKDSLFSEDLQDDFRHQVENYSILSFFETRPMDNIGVIVDKKSATIGLPGQREQEIAVEANHRTICKFDNPENEAYQLVEPNIIRLAEEAVKASKNGQIPDSSQDTPIQRDERPHGPTWFVPLPENANFAGREKVFQRLVENLKSETGQQRRVALFGLGGIGKTQIALKYAYWCRENYKNTSIFWVNASTFEKFHQSFMELAKHLRIPGAESPKADILGLVRNWLSQEKECGTWVMILHDADDFSTLFEPSESQGQSSFPGKLADYIPKCQHGSILITTRDKQVATRMVKGLGPLIQIPPMGTSESIDLLSKILKGEEYEEKDIEKLADALEHLPLALSQAAAFILENSVSIGIYLQLLRDNRTNAFELLNDDTTGAEAHSAVTTTWIMSFTQIRERNPRAADILSLMAFLDRQDVPADLIKRHYETLSGLEFERACGVLKAFSLINERQLTIHGENHRTFNMQQLVQQATRQWLETHDKSSQQWEENALIAVAKVFPPGEGDDWKKFEIYLPHVQVVLERKIESILGTDAKADLLHHASSYFRVKGYHARAAEMGREAVEIRKQSLGVQHPKTLASHTNLSRILLEQKKVNEARELMAEAVAAAESTVEKSDRDMLRARGHLAALLGIQEKYRDAKHLQKSVVEMSKTALGEEHLDTLLAMRDLAVTYGHRKPYDKAEPLFRRVLEIRKRKLGPDHPETLTSMLDLAEILGLQDPEKNAPKAEVLASQVVEGRKRTLGDEHPATLLAMDTLATTYEWQDRWGEAEALREQIRHFSSIGCKDPENHPQSALRIMSYEITTYKLPKPESRPWPSPDQARKFSTLSNDSMPAPAPSLGPDGDEKMDIRKMKSWTDLKRAVVAISDSIFTSELAIKSDEKINIRTSRSCGDVKSSAIEITTPGGGNGEGRDDDGSGIGSLGGESNYTEEQVDKKAPIKDDKPNHNEEQVERIASTETSETGQVDKKAPIGRDGKNQTEEQVEKRASTDGAEAIQTGEHAEKKASTEGVEANQTKEVEKRASTDCGETTQTKERIEQIASTNDLRPPVDRIITSSSPLLVPWARLEQQWRKRSPLDRFRDRIHSSQDTVAEGQVRKEMEEGRRKSAE